MPHAGDKATAIPPVQQTLHAVVQCPQAGPCSHQPQWPHTQAGKGLGVLAAGAEGSPVLTLALPTLSPPNPWSPLSLPQGFPEAKAPPAPAPASFHRRVTAFPFAGVMPQGGGQTQKQCHPHPGPSRHSQLSVLQGQGWAQLAASLLASPGRRRMHPVSPSTPTHRAADRASPNRDSPSLGLFSATQSPSDCACRAKGSRDTEWHAPNLGERGETP